MNIGLGIGIPFTRSSLWASIFTPSALFLDGSTQGVWYDPSDINLTWRRNLLTYSEQFDNAVWGGINTGGAPVAVSVSPYPSPVGSTAYQVFGLDTTNDRLDYSSDMLATVGATYTYSVWLRGSGTVHIELNTSTGLGGAGVLVVLLTSSWTRYSVSVTYNAAVTGVVRAHAVITRTTGTAPEVHIWGAQLEQGSTATPYQRITDGVQDYLQYQPLPVMYQDAAGTLPVTAVEQPVGLMLDKSKGLVLGSELVTNGDFSNGATGWTAHNGTISATRGVLRIDQTTADYALAYQAITCVIGKWYKLTITVVTPATGGSGSVQLGVGTSFTSVDATFLRNAAAAGTYDLYFAATATTMYVRPMVNITYDNVYAEIDNISVRELPGNHAFNSSGNSANFPVLSARYNLLTKTEQFDDAVWGKVSSTVTANTVAAPDGTLTADYVSFSPNGYVSQSLAISGQYKLSVYAKKIDNDWLVVENYNGSDKAVWFNLSTGIVGTQSSGCFGEIKPAGNGWYQCSLTHTADGGSSSILAFFTAAADGSFSRQNSAYLWGADLRVANDGINLPSYQRVNTATDYDTVGFPLSLRFNGVNQWLQTNSIDFTYSDKMFVSAGVRKLSDATPAILVELSANALGNGAFYVAAPESYVNYSFKSNGTAYQPPVVASGYVAPTTNVLSGISNISGDQSILRINGAQAAISTADQGTGNYGNYPLYIGARAGSSLWFNGRLYQLVIAAGSEIRVAEEDSDLFLSESGDFITAETTVAVIQSAIEQTEAFVNRKTSAF